MSNIATKVPVLIAGGGPTGLVLALTLLKNNIPVRIIDKELAFHVGSRGAGIFPRSMELYHFLGVLPDILKQAEGRLKPWRVYKLPGGTEPLKTFDMIEYTEPTPSIPWNSPVGLGQSSYESILREHISKHGVHVELGTELVGFEQDAEGVTVRVVKRDGSNTTITTETIRADYLVGADGARGSVRKLLGLTFLGETRKEESLLVGDVHVKGLDFDHWHMWGDFTKGFFSLRPTEHPGYYFILSGGIDRDYKIIAQNRDEFIKFVREVTDRTDIEIGHIKWISEFTPNIRMVNKFSEGRVFVAGDAAHAHSPTGAQGMNSSVQDAFNLAWKLSSVIKRLSSPSILETYTTERLPVIREMLSKTTNYLNKTEQYRSGDEDTSAFERPRALYQLGMNCRWSPILVDEQPTTQTVDEMERGSYGVEDPTVLRAGDRAPDAPSLVPVGPINSAKTSFFTIFTPTKHTALVFASSSKEAQDIVAAFQVIPQDAVQTVVVLPQGAPKPSEVPGATVTVVDGEGHAYNGYPPSRDGYRAIIVRPDGVVGAVVRGSDGVRRYLSRVFQISADNQPLGQAGSYKL